MYDLTGFQRDLIYTISGTEEPYGLAIKEALQQYRNEEVNHGRLYPNLDTLVEHGLVDKGDQDQRTNYYEVTAEGQALLSRRREWENQYVTLPQETDHVSRAQSSSD